MKRRGLRWLRWCDVERAPGRLTREAPGWHMRIYVLLDPRDSTVRYVGVTAGELEARRSRHVAEPTNTGMAAWISMLGSMAMEPEVRLLTFAPGGYWQDVEMNWIAWFRARGHLLNKDPGGNYRGDKGKARGTKKAAAGMFAFQLRRERATGRPYFKNIAGRMNSAEATKGGPVSRPRPVADQRRPET